jgi:CRP/FNR family transcriptional regulator, nitrogen oxide reductase regulator
MMVEPMDAVVIQRCFLFTDLTPEERDAVLAAGRQCQIPQGQYFFHQGEEADRMYLITAGRVKLTQVNADGDQIIVNYFGPGEGLGIIVALSQMSFPLSAEAVEDCTAVVWSQAAMRRLTRQIPQLAFNGMEMIGRRFARLQQQFNEVSNQRVEQRVALALLRLVRQFGKKVDQGVLIDMPITRQELAQMTGTNVYHVSRIISRWEQDGLVDTGRKRIVLCKAHELVVIAEDLPQPPKE